MPNSQERSNARHESGISFNHPAARSMILRCCGPASDRLQASFSSRAFFWMRWQSRRRTCPGHVSRADGVLVGRVCCETVCQESLGETTMQKHMDDQ